MSPDRADLAAHPGVRWMTVVGPERSSRGSAEDRERDETCKRIWSLAEARAEEMDATALAELEVCTADGRLVLVRDGPSIAAAAVEDGAAAAVIRYELRRALRT